MVGAWDGPFAPSIAVHGPSAERPRSQVQVSPATLPSGSVSVAVSGFLTSGWPVESNSTVPVSSTLVTVMVTSMESVLPAGSLAVLTRA